MQETEEAPPFVVLCARILLALAGTILLLIAGSFLLDNPHEKVWLSLTCLGL